MPSCVAESAPCESARPAGPAPSSRGGEGGRAAPEAHQKVASSQQHNHIGAQVQQSSSSKKGVAAARPPRVRETTLGPVDWDKVDPLALSMADRQSDSDARYVRKDLSAEDMERVKMRWQARQLKRVSNAAVMFGPRESMKHLFADEEEEEEDWAAPLGDCPSRTDSVDMWHRPPGSVSSGGSIDHSAASQASTLAAVAQRQAAGRGGSKAGMGKQISSMFKSMLGRKPSDRHSIIAKVQATPTIKGNATI